MYLEMVTEVAALLPVVAADPHAVNLTEARCFEALKRHLEQNVKISTPLHTVHTTLL